MSHRRAGALPPCEGRREGIASWQAAHLPNAHPSWLGAVAEGCGTEGQGSGAEFKALPPPFQRRMLPPCPPGSCPSTQAYLCSALRFAGLARRRCSVVHVRCRARTGPAAAAAAVSAVLLGRALRHHQGGEPRLQGRQKAGAAAEAAVGSTHACGGARPVDAWSWRPWALWWNGGAGRPGVAHPPHEHLRTCFQAPLHTLSAR